MRAAPQLRQIRPWWIVAAVVLVALVIAFSVPWKLNFMRGWIGERVQSTTGRALVIEGDLWWHWGWPSRLEAGDVRFANPAWAGRPEMLTVKLLDVRIQAWPLLLHKRLVLPHVRAIEPDLWLEVGEDGRSNWLLDQQQKDASTQPALGHVWLDRGVVHFVRAPDHTAVVVQLQNVRHESSTRLRAVVNGRWRGMPLQLSAEGDDALKLLSAHTPYALSLHGDVSGTRVRAQGQVTGLEAPESASLQIDVSGPSLGDWYRIAGVGLPETPPYRTAGHLSLDKGVWRYERFTGRIGESDIGGEIAFEQRQPRPLLTGSLVSQRLRLRDLGPAFGTTPETRAAAAPAKPASGANAERRVLPQRRFSAKKWDTLDADVMFDGRTIQDAGPLAFDRLKMHAQLKDKHLTLSDVTLGVAEGRLQGSMQLDGRREPMQAQLSMRLSHVQLEDLVPQLRKTKMALGVINGRVELAGAGDSYAQLLAHSDGQAQLAMGHGQISNLLIEIAGLDVAESLKFWLGHDKTVQVRCALVDVGVQGGLMRTRTAVFDTSDTFLAAEGTLNFADERLDFTVHQAPKDRSPLALRVPLHVRGTLGQPSITPDAGKLAARGGAALLLGAINPLAAIIPLIEVGPGHDSDCAALVEDARRRGVPVQSANQAPKDAGSDKEARKETGNQSTKEPGKQPSRQSERPASGAK